MNLKLLANSKRLTVQTPTLVRPLKPNPRSSVANRDSQALIIEPNPYDQVYDWNTPVGFSDYGALLTYYVTRGKPTYKLVDYPPDKAVVALQSAFFVIYDIVPYVYFWLHVSLVPQSWYFIYRYISNGSYQLTPGMGPMISPEEAQQQGFQFVLISKNLTQPAPKAAFPCQVFNNPRLAQVSLGNNVPS